MIINSLFILSILFFSCSASPRFNSSSNSNINKSNIFLISSKKINKKTSYKKELSGYSSWYGPNFHGNLTANGEIFDQYAISAAHRTLPLNSVVSVTNLENGRKITLRINDRGPFIDEHKRILDCSYGAAKKLGFLEKGTTKIKIDVVEIGDNKYIKRK